MSVLVKVLHRSKDIETDRLRYIEGHGHKDRQKEGQRQKQIYNKELYTVMKADKSQDLQDELAS